MLNSFIFDMDGVLADTEQGHLLAEYHYLRSAGVKDGLGFLEEYSALNQSEMLREAVRRFRLDSGIEVLMNGLTEAKVRYFSSIDIKVNKGVRDLLKYLGTNGYKTALASSSPMAVIIVMLNRLCMTPDFDVILSGEDSKHGKPGPDIYLGAVKKLKSKPSECIALEDSQAGVSSAKAAGIACIGYRPHGTASDLRGADFIVSDIGRVKDILASLA